MMATGRAGSATLEHAPALVVGDDLREQALLGPAVVEVVLPDFLTERALGELAALPEIHRLRERRREGLRLGGLVRVADQLRPGIGCVLDAVEPGGDHRREAEVRVHVGARDAALDASRLPVTDDAEPARAIVAAPRARGRRPAL